MASEIRYLDIDCVGEVTGTRYVGKFESKLFLTLKDRAEAGKIKNKLLKDVPENDDIFFLLSLLSNINLHLTKSPEWWGEDGTDLKDAEPVIALAKSLREAQQIEVDSKKPAEAVVAAETKKKKND